MHEKTSPQNSVITNVDVNELSQSALVRAFMFRVLDQEPDPLPESFVLRLADDAARAFDLYLDDGGIPPALQDVAASSLALEIACRRALR